MLGIARDDLGQFGQRLVDAPRSASRVACFRRVSSSSGSSASADA
jgi:hypothetical protein